MALRSQQKAVIPAKILLVDDNRAGLAARRMVLQELGYVATCVSSPSEALLSFGKGGFDLVVTDYKMPEMNGIELITAIREVKPAVPIILISGFVDALGLTEKTTGADAVVMKSSREVEHLIRAVKHLLTAGVKRKPAASAAAAVKKARRAARA